jgi:hypothetical protein
MYPKIEADTQTMPCGNRLAVGNNTVIVGFNDCAVAWGTLPAGTLGFEGDIKKKGSTKPMYLENINDLHVVDVSAGYGHVMYTLKDKGDNVAFTKKFNSFPKFTLELANDLAATAAAIVTANSNHVGEKRDTKTVGVAKGGKAKKVKK